jgi:hypothetical protein
MARKDLDKRRLLTDNQFYLSNVDLISDLRLVVHELHREGHAVALSEEYINDKLTGATAYHYRSCELCRKEGRKL